MKSTKLELQLNNKQRTLLLKSAGTARYAYNWALGYCIEYYEKHKKSCSAIDLHRVFVAEVKSDPEKAWLKEVSKSVPQQSFRHLQSAYAAFFKRIKTKQKGGFPRFKKKFHNESFTLEGGSFKTEGNRICVPKIGWLRCKEEIPEHDVIKSVTISIRADKWFVSFIFQRKIQKKESSFKSERIGVDLGIKTLATLSDGTTFANLRPYKTNKKKLAHLQRIASRRRVKGKEGKEQSKRYHKAQAAVRKLHFRISCVRKDAIHKLTTHLAKNHSEVVIEDLNIKGMSKNHKLASAILDGGFYEFRRQLGYKCPVYGSKLTVADRFFPSSKTCSCCGNVKADLKLSDRIYHCQSCGYKEDRDLNAAINLEEYKIPAASSAVEARGEPKNKKGCALEGSVKREENNKSELTFKFV